MIHKSSITLKELQRAGMLLPQEEMLEVGRRATQVSIGLPKESSFQENRIALVPSAVGLLTAYGHQVLIESDAGKNAYFQDKDYAEAGARIVYSKEEIYKADIVLKISPPTEEEIELIRAKQILFSAVQLGTQYSNVLRKLISKKATALAFNYLKDESGVYPVVKSMGEIAGSTALLIAAEYLSNENEGIGIMLGGVTGIPPVEVVIIGAGIVGENAARTALGLGAEVRIFDNSLSRLSRLKNYLGNRQVFTSLIQQEELAKRLSSADVAIGALRAPEGRTPCVVTEQMVSDMKYGSVIVDVSIDQGGCFETSEITSHNHPVYKKFGVTHYCVPNIPSRVAHTASIALSNIITPVLVTLGEEGGLEKMLHRHMYLRSSVYLYQGILTNRTFGEMYALPYKDIELLMAAL
ncbi:MAG: alanine dehydrogenase [Candidatus Competibacteraceae bacterium]|nr:alanine dehydrogenase [Candidatus Competibacteraceae bacterium]